MGFESVKKFEEEISSFYGSKYAVATDCCTHAIELCLRYTGVNNIKIPARTYVSIPFVAEKLGIDWEWEEKDWLDFYLIGNTNIIDAAVLWEEGSYIPDSFMCLSFQYQKHLNLSRGGMILTDDETAARELKKMSYDGRDPNIPWRDQDISCVGYHYYMTPETAELGLEKLALAKQTEPKQWLPTDWPDLRNMGVFKNKDYNNT